MNMNSAGENGVEMKGGYRRGSQRAELIYLLASNVCQENSLVLL